MAKRAEYLGPERRRPMVLDAALAIFSEGGFSDASMAAIAERAGISKAVLYDCFPGGKQEIYYAMLDRCGERFLTHMVEVLEHSIRLPLDEALTEGLDALIGYAESHPLEFKVIFGEAGTSDAEIAKRAAHTREVLVHKMGERTREIMEGVGVPITPLADVYNKSIVAIAEEMCRWVLQDPSLPRRAIVRALVTWLMQGFETIIPGTAWREPSKAGEAGSAAPAGA